jgi:glycosyltransferase involved in cell wall biosynthesis
MKLFAALGPGDIVGAARTRKERGALPTTSIAFSEQLFDYCRAANIRLLAISSCPRLDEIQDGLISAENRPKASSSANGLMFHWVQTKYALYLAYRAWRFGADAAVIDSGMTHYFALALFRLIDVPVIVNLHNVLWPAGFPPRKFERVIRFLNSIFFRYFAAGGIGVSPECERQVMGEARNRIPFFQYRCQFSKNGFVESRPYTGGEFHIAFVGRAEPSKGVLEIPKISSCLSKKCSVPIMFHICGDGSALTSLRSIVENRSMQKTIFLHGHLDRAKLLEVYSSCHAVIVPTSSTFAEGMPQVCAEATLMRLPIITSQVTNALDVVGPATLEAIADDVESYVDAIYRMLTDSNLYGKMRSECRCLSKQFFDRSQSFPAALDRLLRQLFQNFAGIDDWDSLFALLES